MRRRISLLVAIVVSVVAATPSAASAQAPAPCPGTFHVIHDDRIGALSLPAGQYAITVLDATINCSDAFDLFRQFLEDYDGRLPGGWKVDAATATFSRFQPGFRVARSAIPPPSPSARECPFRFEVEHNDHIGRLAIPRGTYRLDLLSVGPVSCVAASRDFARFLQDYDGVLPRPWRLDPSTGSFTRGSRHIGFRIKPWSGYLPPGPGGRVIVQTGKRCPGTFRVLNNDRIGRLKLRRGPYRVTRLGSRSPSCARASTLLAGFLQDFDGVLPAPWKLSPATATFTRGTGSRAGFRIKPARAR